MFNSTVLDVATGLIFVFLAVSLSASAAAEAIASVVKLRSTTLKSGIMDLLNDQKFDNLAAELYAHALINPRGPGLSDMPPAGTQNQPAPASPAPVSTVRDLLASGNDAAKRSITKNLGKNLPAYIDPKQFADALLEVLTLVPTAESVPTMAQLQAQVNKQVPASLNPQINQLLNGIIVRSGGDLTAIRNELAGWFNNAMDRLSWAFRISCGQA